MNIYIDESGSINNHVPSNKYFVIAMIRVIDKRGLEKAYKRFISSNLEELRELDREKVDETTGKVLKAGNKMFIDGRFVELKGSQFDQPMKKKFLEFFSREPYFEIFYIKIINGKLTNKFCSNTSRVFNYSIRLAMNYFIKNNLLPNERCVLQLDERNEKTEAKYFLENYLNTELLLSEDIDGPFTVTYFDSCNNKFIQIADVFANVFYSDLVNHQYSEQLEVFKEKEMLRCVFEFPK